MAIAQTTLTSNTWSLIGNNVTSITFQCISQNPIYIGITTNLVGLTSTAPGLVYNRLEGELKRPLTDLTYLSSPAYVWARSISSYGTVNFETS